MGKNINLWKNKTKQNENTVITSNIIFASSFSDDMDEWMVFHACDNLQVVFLSKDHPYFEVLNILYIEILE